MKKLIWLFLGIILLLVVFISFKKINSTNNTTNNKIDETKQEEKVEQEKINTEIKGFEVNEFFDTSKFDKNKFNGIVYKKDGTSYDVKELLSKSEGNFISLLSYYLTKDIEKQTDAFKYLYNNSLIHIHDDDDDIKFIKEIFGDPTSIYEKADDAYNLISHYLTFVYDYGDYVVVVTATDFTRWEKYSYDYPGIETCFAVEKEQWLSDKPHSELDKESSENYKLYGKDITE